MPENEQLEKYLKLARRAKDENNSEDAKKYYDMARTEDPDNIEARFFYPYYRLWDSKKGDWYTSYIDFINAIYKIIDDLSVEDCHIIPVILEECQSIPATASKIQMDLWRAKSIESSQYNTQNRHCQKLGIELFYDLGNCVEKLSDDPTFINLALDAWKEGVRYQQQWPYCGIDKSLVETYVGKIKKHDASYEPPKKAGCISFAK